MGTEEALIRVERGRPDEAELAAVVAVLLALQAGARQTAGPAPAARLRWSRGPGAYTAPDSWR
ncbi:acyl-CoA carboxylase epsilon subunit [Streptomyces zaehneri]|uniref:acyl-CoA carboxylase epsilon subunit n=1 Tax=Streptomyces zaehneri TaxID=3051180 RepID=UPI0028D60EA2|nr:acyl-CoA carboxylase epsilon subunit [Streptomyces sp. DSM 40713]